MKDDSIIKLDTAMKSDNILSGIDPSSIISLLRRHWYWFGISIAICLLVARFYINHTMPVYRVSTIILINQPENRQVADNAALLEGLGLPGGMQNIENQIMLLRSRSLTERTLNELSFDTEYYIKTLRNKLPLYPDTPIAIVRNNNIPFPKDIEFSFIYIGNEGFTLSSNTESYPFQVTSRFGEIININGCEFYISCNNEGWLINNPETTIFLVSHSERNLINFFNGRTNVELLTRGGSILRISITGTNRVRDADYLNKLVEVFQQLSLDKKNNEANRRIAFIDDQLIGISDSLMTTENRLQQFRSANRVMDISAQGQAIIAQVTQLENERARLNLEANYYDYLADYLSKNTTSEAPIVPITMGITDPGLTRLVEELAGLQGQLTTTGAGEMNPLQRNLENRLRTTRDAVRETLNGLRRANSLARSENNDQINKANAQASVLPSTERQLLGFERKFRLNDELYTFLLEIRAEQQMQKASNRADSEVIDYADENYSAQIAPNSNKIYLFGLLAGAGIPFIILFLGFIFDNRLREEDLDRISSIPVLGRIPHDNSKNNRIVFDSSDSVTSEAFRQLRSRLQFFIKETTAPVILVTSAMPDDGKTFTAINLAAVYSLLGKKTVLVGFDLRKPKIIQDFNLSNEKGVSTLLIGQDQIEEIIQESGYTNLSIITSGPIPPNPAELIALPKTGDLLSGLKDKFDIIIIDTSPLGVVSDTIHLASLSDTCLLVVRPGSTMKSVLEPTIHEINTSSLKGVSLVINDIKINARKYGYGKGYGYVKNENKRRLLFRK